MARNYLFARGIIPFGSLRVFDFLRYVFVVRVCLCFGLSLAYHASANFSILFPENLVVFYTTILFLSLLFLLYQML